MNLIIDYNFTYKNIFRYLIINKIGNFTNTYNLPNINKLIIYFFFNKLENINNNELYNSFYFFKFFFGKNTFFTKTFSFYSLGKYYYNFNIQLIINKQTNIFININIIKNNINFNNNINKFINNNIFQIKLINTKIFSEIKTNLGLFYLPNLLNINFYLIGGSKSYKTIINILNLKIN